MKVKEQTPDYKRIFDDMITIKFPDKRKYCDGILKKKKKLSVLDVLKLNAIIFGHKEESQRFRSYDQKAIKEILNYQKKYQLRNSELADIFKLSRNTVTKWKKMFP